MHYLLAGVGHAIYRIARVHANDVRGYRAAFATVRDDLPK
jgi:hypothetical protein